MNNRELFESPSEYELDHIPAYERHNTGLSIKLGWDFLKHLYKQNIRQLLNSGAKFEIHLLGNGVSEPLLVDEKSLAERLLEDELEWLCPQPTINPETRIIDLMAFGVNPNSTAGRLLMESGKPTSLAFEIPGGIQVMQVFNPNSSKTP